MVTYDEDGMLEPKSLQCWTCGGEVVEEGFHQDFITLHCKNCEEELSRLSDIESEHIELKARFEWIESNYTSLLKRHEETNRLYTDLQDHIKAILQ